MKPDPHDHEQDGQEDIPTDGGEELTCLEGCFRRHRPNDPMVGEPICAQCFDYESMIVWNALAPELWRRTVQDIRRGIARAVGMSEKACHRLAWLNYFKVDEYQLRGAIHFHAILRLDDGAGRYDPEAMLPPPEPFDMALLEAVVRNVVPAVRAPDPRGGRIGWGRELDVKRLTRSAAANELSEEVVAFYVAKYASKGSESLGAALDHRIRTTEALMALQGLRSHIGSAVRIAWIMGGRPELAELGLRHWAHCLGFGGHFATKSRRYSTTFKVLRVTARSTAAARASRTRPPSMPGTVPRTTPWWSCSPSGASRAPASAPPGTASLPWVLRPGRWRGETRCVRNEQGRWPSHETRRRSVARPPVASAKPVLPAPVRLLTVQEVAELLQVPVQTIYAWRFQRRGPTPMRIGRYLRFDPADVARWVESRKEA